MASASAVTTSTDTDVASFAVFWTLDAALVRSTPPILMEVTEVFVDTETWTVNVYVVLDPSSAVIVTVTVFDPTLRDELPVTTTVAFESTANAETVTDVVPLGTVTTSFAAMASPPTVKDCKSELVEGM